MEEETPEGVGARHAFDETDTAQDLRPPGKHDFVRNNI
jgi:hypothetical protein